MKADRRLKKSRAHDNERVLFDIQKGRKNEKDGSDLKKYPIWKCVEGERVICIQRQHEIAYILPVIFRIIVVILILISLSLFPFFTRSFTPSFINSPSVTIYLMLVVISGFLVFELFNFMSWYYQFYVITNKALIHRSSFRLGGEYSEAVFGEKMHVQDIIRDAPNILYDFLKIQNVSVYFHEIERKEPFVFRTPQNGQQIEDLIQGLIIEAKHQRISS